MRYFILLSLTLLISAGCKKRTLFTREKDGLVIWTGPIAVDAGCDWMIDIEGTRYKPLNLDPEFQQDSLRVRVKYHLRGKRRVCEWGKEAITMKISGIWKR